MSLPSFQYYLTAGTWYHNITSCIIMSPPTHWGVTELEWLWNLHSACNSKDLGSKCCVHRTQRQKEPNAKEMHSYLLCSTWKMNLMVPIWCVLHSFPCQQCLRKKGGKGKSVTITTFSSTWLRKAARGARRGGSQWAGAQSNPVSYLELQHHLSPPCHPVS